MSEHTLKIVPCAMPCSLLDCPPGLFIHAIDRDQPTIGFKSEYGCKSVDNIEVYDVETGECFWGETSTVDDRAQLKVIPARLGRCESRSRGWKLLRPCTACSGSGYYDAKGSPKCGACGGSGTERFRPVNE